MPRATHTGRISQRKFLVDCKPANGQLSFKYDSSIDACYLVADSKVTIVITRINWHTDYHALVPLFPARVLPATLYSDKIISVVILCEYLVDQMAKICCSVM